MVRLWDTTSGREIHVYRNVKITTELYDFTHCFVCFSPDGKRIATNPGGSAIVILDAESGEIVVQTQEINTAITCLCFSQDGTRLLTGSKESRLIVDANTGVTIREVTGLEGGAAPIDFSPDRNQVLCTDGQQIQIWDANRVWDADCRSTEVVLVGHDSDIRATRFIDGGEKLWTNSGSLILIWESRSGIPLMPIHLDPSPIRVMYSLNGKCCLQFHEQNASLLRLLNMDTGEILFDGRWAHEDPVIIQKFNISPDGGRLGFTGLRSITIIDTSRNMASTIENIHDDRIRHISFSVDGARVATASDDHSVRVWNAVTGELDVLISHKAGVQNAWLSLDGRQVVSCSLADEQNLRLFDATTGAEKFVLNNHGLMIRDISFSPDGTRIVGRTFLETIFIWDARTGNLLEAIEGRGDIHAIAADVEGKSFRLLVRDGEAIVENLSGQIVARHPDVFDHITTHSDGRTWAGAISNYLALIHLEGANNS